MKTASFWRRISASAIILCMAIASKSAYSQTEPVSSRDKLLRLVPENVGICFVLSDLKNAWPKIVESKWFSKLKKTTAANALLRIPEAKELARFRTDLEQLLNVKWQRLRDDILGDQLVFAYFPNLSSPTEEHGLVLVHVRDAKLLHRLIQQVNEKQQQSGELRKLVPMEHQGVAFMQREEKNGSHYYWLDGPIVAVSSEEAVIREIITRHALRTKSVSKLHKQFKKAGAAQATAAVFFNPRILEQEFSKKVAGVSGPEKRALQSVHQYLKALEGVVVTANVEDGIELRFSLLADVGQLPEAGKRFFTKPTLPSSLWSYFPEDSIFTVAGRIHAAETFRTITEMLPIEQRTKWIQQVTRDVEAALHLDLQNDLLPNIGPDWGICIFESATNQVLPEFLAAVAIRSGSTDVDQAVFRGLDRIAWSLVFHHNKTAKQRIRMKSLKKKDADMFYFESEALFPDGFRPTLALKNGYLLLASTPNAVERFRSRKSAVAGNEAPLLRFSFRACHAWLSANRQHVSSFLAKKNNLPLIVTHQIVGGVLEGLSVFDRATVHQRTGDGVASWRLGLR